MNKSEAKTIGLIAWWVLLIGFIGPFLVSAENDAASVAGIALVILTALYTMFAIRDIYLSKIATYTKQKEEQDNE